MPRGSGVPSLVRKLLPLARQGIASFEDGGLKMAARGVTAMTLVRLLASIK